MSYFAARHDPVWRWADDGDVIIWNDGTTVAFRQELIHILEWLVPHGWPPFGALVWVLAACRGKLPSRVTSERVGRSSASQENAAASEMSSQMDLFRDHVRKMHATVEDGLAAIANLPTEIRSSWKAKATLVEMIFSQSEREIGRPELLEAVVEALRSGLLTDVALNDYGVPIPDSPGEWLTLHAGLAQIAPESLALRVRTGLDAVPEAAPILLPPAVRVRQVLDELRADSEHAGLARLVRDFMAAIQLPRRLSEQDEMATGGFADISNRGDPDRLLLSELAHDDMTLAVRIALNEALYLRREPPARQPPGTLAVLIDSGVRLWGVPRVLASAAALALVAKDAVHERCTIYRASGSQLTPVDLLTKAGIIAHLGALEPHAHPGAALAAFQARLEEDERPEAVLITHREVWTDPDFQRDLALSEIEDLFVALVDRDGSFTLQRYPRGGSPLCQAMLEVEDLLPAQPGSAKRQKLLDLARHPDLPLALSTEPFPLLVPICGKVQKSIVLRNDGGACVMHDRRLLAWRSLKEGARTVTCCLPRGKTLWLGEHHDGTLCVVKATSQSLQLACRVFSPEGELLNGHDWSFPDRVVRVESHGDVIFIIRRNEAEVRDLVTGAVLGTLTGLGSDSHGRYFFQRPDTLCVLSWNGQKLHMDPLVLLGNVQSSGILRVFQNHDVAGPCVLMKNGDVFLANGARVLKLGPLKPVVRISEDGRRLLIARAGDAGCAIVNLRTYQVRDVRGYIRDSDWIWTPAVPTRNVYVHVRRISFHAGWICLQTSQSKWSRMSFATGAALQPMVDPAPALLEAREFEPMEMPARPGYSLKVARWPDGRRAWLDSRGLLHLRCADPKLPEMTIVLSNGPLLSMWMSNGRWSGDPFFIGDHVTVPIEEFLSLLGSFVNPK
jgi:hypothetical protein